MAQYSGIFTTTQQMQAKGASTWPFAPASVSYLVVAGGGTGGSACMGGGGGAGGLVYATNQAWSGSNSFSVTVGYGGYLNDNTGYSGDNSVVSGTGITTITASH